MTASMPEKSVPTLRGRGNIAGGSIVAVIAAPVKTWVVASSLGGEPGHEPGREPERRPGCGFGTELWRDLLPLLESRQMANTLPQVPEGARFTLKQRG